MIKKLKTAALGILALSDASPVELQLTLLTRLGSSAPSLPAGGYAACAADSEIGGDIDAMDLPVSFHIP